MQQHPPELDTEQALAAERVLLFGLDTGDYDAQRSMDELEALARANDMEPVAQLLQKRQRPDGATALGSGRLEEAKELAQNLEAESAIYDGELSGSQLRNISEKLGLPVIDRTMLILSIFKSRAVTREGKTQTELATLEYRLPRLSGLGAVLSRQGGGGGGGAGARRGGGETQLEYDRRYIRSRISILKKRLEAMQARREETRRSRAKSAPALVALVGYTNVGKSSLMNALTGSEIAARDRLFETLDPTARHLELPGGQEAILIDTVGFVSRLPHKLVEAFKSTLEEARYADLLLKVCDAADPAAEEQLAVTDEVLASLGAKGRQLTVYNKCDRLPAFHVADPAAFAVSAHTGQGLPALLEAISKELADRVRRFVVCLPYAQLALADVPRRHGKVEAEEYRPDGLYLKGVVEARYAYLLAPFHVEDESEETKPGV